MHPFGQLVWRCPTNNRRIYEDKESKKAIEKFQSPLTLFYEAGLFAD